MIQEFSLLLEYFIRNEGPWALLFVTLFIVQIRQAQKREEKMREDAKLIQAQYQEKLNSIHQNSVLMLETWKIIFEREIERRETKNGTRHNSNKRGGDRTDNRGLDTGNKDGNTGESN